MTCVGKLSLVTRGLRKPDLKDDRQALTNCFVVLMMDTKPHEMWRGVVKGRTLALACETFCAEVLATLLLRAVRLCRLL